MSILTILLISAVSILGADSRVNLTVSLLITNSSFLLDGEFGYSTSAGAMVVALNKGIKDKIYNPDLYNITFMWRFVQCDQALTVGYASEVIRKHNASVIFSSCPGSSMIAAALAAYKNIPIFMWTIAGPELRNSPKYPTIVNSAGNIHGSVRSTANLLSYFNWTEAGFLYTRTDTTRIEYLPLCSYYIKSLQSGLDTYFGNVSLYSRFATNDSVAGFQAILNTMKTRARVIITCLENRKHRRNLMMAASLNKMVAPEYVYLFVQISAMGFGKVPFWEPLPNEADNFSAVLKEAAKSVLILDNYIEETPIKEQVDKEIVENIKNWPFFEKNASSTKASNLASYLSDSFYMYLQCLNWTYTKYGESKLTNGKTLLERLFMSNKTVFPSLWGLDASNKPTVFGVAYSNINDVGAIFTPNYETEADSIWAIRGGKRPLSTPICGFDGICPPSVLFVTLVSIGSVALFISIIIFLLILVFICKHQERKRMNALWQIPFSKLVKQEQTESAQTGTISIRSESSENLQILFKQSNDNVEYFYLDKEIVVAHKHSYHGNWSFSEEDEFRKMRTLDHANLNRFLGISISGNIAYFLWDFCERGNIISVIKSHSFRFDSTILLGIISDIAEGLHYIHNSFGQHGSLSAYNCVVGDRFDVRIQCYGSSAVKSRTFRRQDSKSALYVAPEHLQGNQNEIGSKSGDIYSFAIIASVLITMKPAFGIEDVNRTDLLETIRKVKMGKYPPFRPSFDTDIDIHSDIVTLIKSCWSEIPSERPNIEQIIEVLHRISGGNKSRNLMDHMFSLMENSAAELENDVKMRTLELKSEQKKADILLYRIMPKTAADKLKIGESVTPEVFEQATVLFADIVSFTVLSSKSTPLQIINFLNDLYTLADSVIEKHDVYKVETIGDGMHIVSGVPNRNGNNHVKEIINMAIDFQQAVKTIRLSHLKDQQIQMRIGVHSGSCVAGIVGVTNPRYIVLGDTVNTAARMEASGRAGQIHITKATRDLLSDYFPESYKIEERGETLIKGIGTMNTYWVDF